METSKTYQENLVSVVMPAYNSAGYIDASIESVEAQTYSEWELIVIDDFSTDDTLQHIDKYHDNRIKVLRQDHNLGVARSRNNGIEVAKGRYIAFLDSDDIWLPYKLEHQLIFMQENDIGFSYTQYRQFTDNPESTGKLVNVRPSVDYRGLLKGNDIGCLTVMLDRKKYPSIHMPACRHEDYATWLNLLREGGRAYSLKEDLARYRKSNHSLTSNKLRSLLWTWSLYRDNQHISLLKTTYYMGFYMTKGIRKHYIK